MKAEYDDLIVQACAIYLPDTDYRLYKAQLYQESRLNPLAVSPAGAGGLAQFMPKTWEEISLKAGFGGRDRFDPEASVMCGAFYMAELLEKWHSPRPEIDRYCLALASYNAGFGNILKAQKAARGSVFYAEIMKCLPEITGKNAHETIDYAKRILKFYADQVTGESL